MNRPLLVLLVVSCSTNLIQAQTFDFEEQPHAVLTSVVSTVGGVTLTATSTFDSGFVFSYPPPPSLASQLGERFLVGLQTEDIKTDGFAPLRMDFSVPLISLSLNALDGGGDDDGTVRIRAFNSSGMELASDSQAYPADFSEIITLSVTAPGFSYIIADSFGGPSNFNSVNWDNVMVVAVPEPSSCVLAVVLTAFSTFTWRIRRSHRPWT